MRKGNVISAHAIAGPEGAFREAENAEKRLTFKPVRVGGVPVSASFRDSVALLPLELWCNPGRKFPLVHDPNTIHIQLERRYPSMEPQATYYVVTISGDRSLEIKRVNRHFPNPGGHSNHISPESYSQLLDEFRRANFFSMCDSYVVDMTDGSGEIISFSSDNGQKTVAAYYGQWVGLPDTLTKLANTIDELAGIVKSNP